MNREQAREILLLYRPGTADAQDPEITQAMELARKDPELGLWFEQHQAFQVAMRAKFQQLVAPQNLKEALLARQKIIRPAIWWQQPAWLTAAAALFLLLGLLVFWPRTSIPDRFANYRQVLVGKAEGLYAMDWDTADMAKLRHNFQEKGAPHDYELPTGLGKLQLTGGVKLTWRTHPVSMVCFKRPDQKPVWLFVMNRDALKDPPPPAPVVEQVHWLETASWTKGDKTYVLAAPPEGRDFLKMYF